jgi:hypothetical protein
MPQPVRLASIDYGVEQLTIETEVALDLTASKHRGSS